VNVEFRIADQAITSDKMVEVWREGEFIAGIYPHDEGLRVVSKHLDGAEHESARPPAIIIKFSE